MKAKNERNREKSNQMKEKLVEKQEKIREIEKKNDKDRKLIIKKMESMEKKKIKLDKIKEDNLLKLIAIRNNNLEKTRTNKSILELKAKKKIADILFDEEEKFHRVLGRQHSINNLKSYSQIRVIDAQKEKEKKMKDFLKKMNSLQNSSVMKKTERQKKAIYLNKLKREEEERKKEEEKRLDKLMGIS